MKKRVIVFDVDGVIIDSATSKYEAFFTVMKKYNFEKHPEIEALLEMRVNRGVLAQAVFQLFGIPQEKIFQDISYELKSYEGEGFSYPMIPDVRLFIEENYEKYDFFTNTSMYKNTVENIFHQFGILHYFQDIFAYDTGTKRENIEHIITRYSQGPENILFIDDLTLNIQAVQPTGVHTLLFVQDRVSLQEKVNSIFK